jgi:hypothetical protein
VTNLQSLNNLFRPLHEFILARQISPKIFLLKLLFITFSMHKYNNMIHKTIDKGQFNQL